MLARVDRRRAEVVPTARHDGRAARIVDWKRIARVADAIADERAIEVAAESFRSHRRSIFQPAKNVFDGAGSDLGLDRKLARNAITQ
jgi:hypothetical protein